MYEMIILVEKRQPLSGGSSATARLHGRWKTRAEALANAEVVISEWLEIAKLDGRDIPEPKGRLMYA